MNKKPKYKPHVDDLVYATKVFVNELSKVQNDYFDDLCEQLELKEEGTDWLFDYIFNEPLENMFTEYLELRGLDIKNFQRNKK